MGKDSKDREYEKRISGDVNDFVSELIGKKPIEYPRGHTETWREARKKKSDRRYDTEET